MAKAGIKEAKAAVRAAVKEAKTELPAVAHVPRAKPTSAELAARAMPTAWDLAGLRAHDSTSGTKRSKRKRSRNSRRSKSPAEPVALPERLTPDIMFPEAARKTKSEAARLRWKRADAQLRKLSMWANLSDKERRKAWRAGFKGMSPEELKERAARAEILAMDCAEMRRVSVAEEKPLRASWWSQRARSALAVQHRALARIAGLDRSWVLGASGEMMRGLEHGDVMQMPRYAAAVQLRRNGGLFEATRAMLADYRYGQVRSAVRNVCKRRGVYFHDGSEAYTTKQCCLCGTVLTKEQMPLGEKLFKCVECPCQAPRDGHAAFNIVFKHLDTDLLLGLLDLPAAPGRSVTASARRNAKRVASQAPDR